MHGRLKIRTTEEQEAAKRIEREKKLKIYIASTKTLFEKHEKKEYNEEALTISREVLQRIPEFYTLWNFRKEIFNFLKPDLSEETTQEYGMAELDLTETCLKKNPKSYCAWEHRFWAMEFMPKPDWNRELRLCKSFLQADERNFHCWDYRRQVTKKCSINPKDELAFTTELIETNFSNYSAWHYRSKLLPTVHPGPTAGSVDEETMLKEYDLVQNAAFTDPNDQSVWFYHRWLLGRSSKGLKLLNVSVLPDQQIAVALFSSPFTYESKNLSIYVNEAVVESKWMPVGDDGVTASQLWYCKLPFDVHSMGEACSVSIHAVINGEKSSLSCLRNGNKVLTSGLLDNAKIFCTDMSAATKDVLQKELESCEQLCELEPENKWTLFTSVLLMRAVDGQKYDATVSKYLEQLVEIDAMRSHYYRDLKSKFVIENYIEKTREESVEVSLAGMQLTSLHYFEHFYHVRKMDISRNGLTSVYPLRFLLCVEVLVLDDNKVSDCNDMKGLQCLKEVSLKNNDIKCMSKLKPLDSCRSLQRIAIAGNPIVQTENLESCFANITLDTNDS